jgi:hypothetical protein
VEDEEASATVEWESEGEHEEDEEASASEEWELEGVHEGVGADDGAERPVSQASQDEDDDDPDKVAATEEEESEVDNETHFGYDPDREVDVWVEYQAAMQVPMSAC